MIRQIVVFTSFIMMVIFGFSQEAREKHPAIRNLERINTAANEDDPFLSPDGAQLLYSSDTSGKYSLYLASRKTLGQPLEPERMLDELTTEGPVRSPFLLPKASDGWEYLYFATQLNTDSKMRNYDIYRVGRFNPKRPFQGNSAASPVQIICTEADEAFPWLSSDAKELYFSRKLETGWQLMHASGKEPRVFTSIEKVEIPVGFFHACLNKAETKMILQGPLKAGEKKQGLFFCKRTTKKDQWSEPLPLTSIISDEGLIGTCSPSLSFDTRFLYFSSDRPGGKGGLDLYVVAISEIEELK